MPKQPDYKELYNLLYRSTNAAMQTLEESISRCRKAYLAACGPRGTGQSQAEREGLRPHFTQLMKLICKEYDVTPAELFAGGGQPVRTPSRSFCAGGRCCRRRSAGLCWR